jgi:regulator of protease activity HflC (stomatin/prohibitin superfamily)
MVSLVETILDFIASLSVFTIITPEDRGILLRGGKYAGTFQPGFHWHWPIYDEVRVVTVVEQAIDLPEQSVTTRDWCTLLVGGTIRYEVSNARKALLNVQDYDETLQIIAMGSLLSYISRVPRPALLYPEGVEEEILSDLQSETEHIGLNVVEFRLTNSCEHKVIRVVGDQNVIPVEE